MNHYVVEKSSIESMVRLTVEKNPSVRLHIRTIIRNWKVNPIRIGYLSNSSVQLTIDIDVLFGKDVVTTVEQTVGEIKKNLEELIKVSVKNVELIVKDIYDEKTDPKSN